MASKEALETAARIRKKHAKKSLPILIMESELWDWNPAKRMLLMAIALGTRKEKEDYTGTFLQEDCPKTVEDMVGWCDMAQWRLALRVGISEDYVQKLLGEFEEEGVLIIDRWTDDNGTNHDMYQVVVDVVKENQRPEQKRHVKRPPYYKVKRGANKGSFSHANQPGKNREVRDLDDEA